MKNTIICIVGRTASGKDKLTREAVEICNRWMKDHGTKFEIVVSYTTRPRRDDDSDDSHIFITEEEYNKKYNLAPKCAYTEIGGNRYFTTTEQIDEMFENDKIPVYIIDPKGIAFLKTIYTDCNIFTIYVDTKRSNRKTRFSKRYPDINIGEEEFVKRDSAETAQFDLFELSRRTDYVICNDDCNESTLSTRIVVLASIMLSQGYDLDEFMK